MSVDAKQILWVAIVLVVANCGSKLQVDSGQTVPVSATTIPAALPTVLPPVVTVSTPTPTPTPPPGPPTPAPTPVFVANVPAATLGAQLNSAEGNCSGLGNWLDNGNAFTLSKSCNLASARFCSANYGLNAGVIQTYVPSGGSYKFDVLCFPAAIRALQYVAQPTDNFACQKSWYTGHSIDCNTVATVNCRSINGVAGSAGGIFQTYLSVTNGANVTTTNLNVACTPGKLYQGAEAPTAATLKSLAAMAPPLPQDPNTIGDVWSPQGSLDYMVGARIFCQNRGYHGGVPTRYNQNISQATPNNPNTYDVLCL